MKNLNDFLENLETSGSNVSSDEFKLLPQQALDLLNRYRLPDPICFISLFLRTAFEVGVDEVSAKLKKRSLHIVASGSGHERLSPVTISELIGTPITSLVFPEHRLAVALQLARSMKYRTFRLTWDSGTERCILTFSVAGMALTSEESSSRSELSLTFEPEKSDGRFFSHANGQFQAFAFAPKPFLLNGTQVNGNYTQQNTFASAYFPAKSVDSQHSFMMYCKPALDNPDFGRMGPLVWFAAEPEAHVQVSRVNTSVPFKRFNGPLPILDRFITLREELDFGLVSFVSHGALMAQLLLKDVEGVELISHSRGLNWDLSGLGIRDDEALLQTLEEIYRDCREFILLCRENLESLRLRTPASTLTHVKGMAGGIGGSTLGGGLFIGAILAGITLPVTPLFLGGLGAGSWLSTRKARGREKKSKREEIGAFLENLDNQFETLEKKLEELRAKEPQSNES